MKTFRLFGLIGYPLGHSFSAAYFNSKFEREGINAEYRNFAIEDISRLEMILEENPSLAGLNVTIPYKEKVQPFMEAISPDALEIGAINVIRVERDGDRHRLFGYNTDVIGFRRSIVPLLNGNMRKALILGTGAHPRRLAADFGSWE